MASLRLALFSYITEFVAPSTSTAALNVLGAKLAIICWTLPKSKGSRLGKPPAKSGGQTPPPKLPTEFAEELERQIGPLIPQQQRGQVISRIVAVVQSEQFSGPIAHPRHLREYEDILPGSAERIIAMAEKQQNHNVNMEKTIVNAQVSDQKRGMRYGLAALALVVCLGTYAGMNGNNALAALLLGAGAIGVVGAFVKGRYEG